jgi:hypothetical protein
MNSKPVEPVPWESAGVGLQEIIDSLQDEINTQEEAISRDRAYIAELETRLGGQTETRRLEVVSGKKEGRGALKWALILAGALLLVFAWRALAQEPEPVPLTALWRANSEDDLAGYKLLYGGASGAYGNEIDVGLDTTTTVLWYADRPIFAVVKAYDRVGNISGPSAEAEWQPLQKVYDVDGDGIVDVQDRRLLRKMYGLTPARMGWDERFDYNDDGIIDAADGKLIKKKYGEKL